METDSENVKRITLKRKKPNPLFQKWLEELYEEAKLKKSKLEGILLEALTSLSKYPLPLKTGAECAILKGFDKKLCSFLDKRLECVGKVKNGVRIEENGVRIEQNGARIEETTHPQNQSRVLETHDSNQCNSNNVAKLDTQKKTSGKKDKDGTYKPTVNSGSYAILLGLLEHSKQNPNNISLSKEALIDKAQRYSAESFTRSKPGSYYTAWSNMSQLIKKGLVEKSKGSQTEFLLTRQGIDLATVLLNESKNVPTVNDIIFKDPSDLTSSQAIVETENNASIILDDENVTQEGESSEGEDYIELLSGRFDVILLIDKNETSGLSKKNDPTVAQFNKYPDLRHEYRNLKVGDFTWVARDIRKKSNELVLPYIVERKRMDDFASSIKDGRFHEQKFRLKKCGLKNVIYLVENYGSNKHVGLPMPSLLQALANTRVQDGFQVHITDSLTNTARFLAMLTKRLTIEYKDKDLKGINDSRNRMLMTYYYFSLISCKSKPLTVTATFIKLLLQLKGVSVEKALAITNVYKTPKCLIKAYKTCPHGEDLLTHLRYGELGSNVGPSVSKSIYQLFSNKIL